MAYRSVVLEDGPAAYWRLGDPADALGIHDAVWSDLLAPSVGSVSIGAALTVVDKSIILATVLHRVPVTAPPGWTHVLTTNNPTSTSGVTQSISHYKRVINDASDWAGVDETWTSSSANRLAVGLMCIAGADLVNPFEFINIDGGNDTLDPSPHNTTSGTASMAGCLHLAYTTCVYETSIELEVVDTATYDIVIGDPQGTNFNNDRLLVVANPTPLATTTVPVVQFTHPGYSGTGPGTAHEWHSRSILVRPASIMAFDETATHHGTYVGSPTLGDAGPLAGDANTAVAFDGVDDAVTMGNVLTNVLAGAFSAELWFKTTTIGNEKRLVSRGTELFDLNINHPNVNMMTFAAGGSGSTDFLEVSNLGLNDGVWHHVVAVCEGAAGSTMRLYFDGVQVGTRTRPSLISENALNFEIGRYPSPLVSYFPGSIDEVAIYPHALTPDRIARHYHHGLGEVGFDLEMSSSRPTAWWKLEEASGTVADDQMNAHDGLFTGSPTFGASGVIGNGVTLNSTSYLTAHGAADVATGGKDFTVEGWFKSQTTAVAWVWAFGNTTSTNPRFLVQLNASTSWGNIAGELTVGVRGDGGGGLSGILNTNIGAKTSDGQWHHLVVSRSGSDWWMYVDGELVSRLDSTLSSVGNVTATLDTFTLNGITSSSSGGVPLGGVDNQGRDEFAIYGRALPAWEIRRHYQRGIGQFGARHDIVLRDGAALWLDAADAPAGAVATWHDLTGNARNVTQATAGAQPSKVDAVFGTQPAVRFDGVDDYLRWPQGAPIPSGPKTIILVHNWRNTTGNNQNVFDSDDLEGRHAMYWSSGTTYLYSRNSGTFKNVAVLLMPFGDFPLAATVWTSVFNGTNSSFRRDGIGTGEVLDLTLSPLNGLTIGGTYANPPGSFTDTDVAEVMVFDRVLLPHELKQIEEEYLAVRYGIGVEQGEPGSGTVDPPPVQDVSPEFIASEEIFYSSGINPPQGSGTEADPYVITEEHHFDTLRSNPSAHFVMGNDIAVTNFTMLPAFTGTFDGRGYEIDFTGNIQILGDLHAGLFYDIRGVVKRLGVVGINVKSSGSGSYYKGGFAGIIYGGTIQDCYVKDATIHIDSDRGGGFFGYMDSGTIDRCYVVATSVNRSGSRVGGFGGWKQAGAVNYSFNNYDTWGDGGVFLGTDNGGTITGSGPRDTSQMVLESNYNTWDFTNTWSIAPSEYPTLQDPPASVPTIVGAESYQSTSNVSSVTVDWSALGAQVGDLLILSWRPSSGSRHHLHAQGAANDDLTTLWTAPGKLGGYYKTAVAGDIGAIVYEFHDSSHVAAGSQHSTIAIVVRGHDPAAPINASAKVVDSLTTADISTSVYKTLLIGMWAGYNGGGAGYTGTSMATLVEDAPDSTRIAIAGAQEMPGAGSTGTFTASGGHIYNDATILAVTPLNADPAPQSVSASFIASGETFFTPVVASDQMLEPTNIASTSLVFSPAMFMPYPGDDTYPGENSYPDNDQVLESPLVASEEEFFAPDVSVGDLPSVAGGGYGGFAYGEASYGEVGGGEPEAPTVSDVSPTFIASDEMFFTHTVVSDQTLEPTNIASTALVSAPSVSVAAAPVVSDVGFIASEEAHYGPALAVEPPPDPVVPTRVESAEQFHVATVSIPAAPEVAPLSIASAEAFYPPDVAALVEGQIQTVFISSGEAFHVATVTVEPPPAPVVPTRVESTATVHTPTLVRAQIVEAGFIASDEVVYGTTVTVTPPPDPVLPGTITTSEVVYAPELLQGQVVATPLVPSAEVVHEPMVATPLLVQVELIASEETFFSVLVGDVLFKVWTGDTYEEGAGRVWDGSEFRKVRGRYSYDGESWVRV